MKRRFLSITLSIVLAMSLFAVFGNLFPAHAADNTTTVGETMGLNTTKNITVTKNTYETYMAYPFTTTAAKGYYHFLVNSTQPERNMTIHLAPAADRDKKTKTAGTTDYFELGDYNGGNNDLAPNSTYYILMQRMVDTDYVANVTLAFFEDKEPDIGAQAQSYTAGKTVSGAIDGASDRDVWKFTTGDDEYTLDARAEKETVDCYLYSDADLTQCVNDFYITKDGRTANLTKLEKNKTYYVVFKCYSNHLSGVRQSYTFSITGKTEAQDVWGDHEQYDLTEPNPEGEYPDLTDPENNWNEIEMSPDETYDCSKAGWNTSVYIKQPGNYTIKGQSESVRVMVESSGVNLFLEDGLNLNCGPHTYVGSRSAAINIFLDSGEKNGWVRIVSKKGASAYLEGYMAPGIRKDGTTTQLIFETEDPSNPGTITAKGGLLSAGIGSIDYTPDTEETTGNMVFNSGNIKAQGGSYAFGCNGGGAGIGGGYCGHVSGITINGGNINACGNEDSAAIGGGFIGNAENIIINGGTVYADTDPVYAGATAAIGSGGGDFYLRTLYAKNIQINGGDITVAAHGEVGIGAGGANKSILEDMKITGGTIHIPAKKNNSTAGIGAANDGSVKGLEISGGVINVEGAMGAPAIGAYGGGYGSEQGLNVQISGGTILASGGGSGSDSVHYAIGMDDNVPTENVAVTITGGSVITDKIQNVKDGLKQTLHRVDVGFKDTTDNGLSVSGAEFSDKGFKYGTDGVQTENGGKVFFWLPSDKNLSLQKLTVNGKLYTGSIKASDTQGTLTGTAEQEAKISIQNAKVVLSAASFTYNGNVQKPSVRTIGGMTLKEGTDYTAEWSNEYSKNAGSYSVKITGQGVYTGTTNAKYTIAAKPVTPNVKVSDAVFTGKARKPAVTVRVGKKTLKKGTDYTVTYKNNVKVGSASVKVTLKGNYKGTKKAAFKILPKQAVVSAAGIWYKTTMIVRMSDAPASTGGTAYQVQYRIRGQSKWKTTSTTNQRVVITQLRSGKKYEVRARAYKTVKGIKYYGAWSKVKKSKKAR